jgi:hypothetical protein
MLLLWLLIGRGVIILCNLDLFGGLIFVLIGAVGHGSRRNVVVYSLYGRDWVVLLNN